MDKIEIDQIGRIWEVLGRISKDEFFLPGWQDVRINTKAPSSGRDGWDRSITLTFSLSNVEYECVFSLTEFRGCYVPEQIYNRVRERVLGFLYNITDVGEDPESLEAQADLIVEICENLGLRHAKSTTTGVNLRRVLAFSQKFKSLLNAGEVLHGTAKSGSF